MQNQKKRGRKEAYNDGGRRGGKEEREEKGRTKEGGKGLDDTEQGEGEAERVARGSQGQRKWEIRAGSGHFDPHTAMTRSTWARVPGQRRPRGDLAPQTASQNAGKRKGNGKREGERKRRHGMASKIQLGLGGMHECMQCKSNTTRGTKLP